MTEKCILVNLLFCEEHDVRPALLLFYVFFRYFEQRLRVMEENYREEIALLQLRLVENALEESVLKISDDR